ncbi:MAG TPA: ABC transporter ATP-binding protein [Polyangiaceae bacterium]|nr:ABC transporter ATP-binding protein [Polyangiaceae bacterium]
MISLLSTMVDTTAQAGPREEAAREPRPLLRVRDLVTSFRTDRGVLRAVDHVSFDVPRAATVALVGESGCGKSVTALSILRLVASPPGRIESGVVALDGRDLLQLPEREMRAVRGDQVSMIFQEPMTSLNPVYTVGWQIMEAIRLHRKKTRRDARARAIELLGLVGIPEPATHVDAYPHQLSGGQRQRVMIAMALACEPKLLVADEPTTALDVTIQAQILELLRELQQRLSMSILLITHDLGVVAENASHVVVMYAGQVVEDAPVKALFAHPMHPYTRGLLDSVPRVKPAASRRLRTIEGMVPDLRDLAAGCRFADRCPLRIDKCILDEPPLEEVAPGRLSRCWRAKDVPGEAPP